MGELPEGHDWRRPIIQQDLRGLHLVDGFLTEHAIARLEPQADLYAVAPFVRELEWHRKLPSRKPSQASRAEIRARASRATTLIELGGDQVLVDPSYKETLPEGNPSVIAVTHAHADHAGGLLDAATKYPQALILVSQSTYDLLRLLPADMSRQIRILFEDRGVLLPTDSSPVRISDTSYRGYPAGHLLGATMLDIHHGDARVLVTGDFALRETAGLPGAVWPEAEYDVLIMESSHAWDKAYPTSDSATNRRSLVNACENLAKAGASRILIIASALGEASEVYYALCEAQMAGLLPRFSLRLAGKAHSVSLLYAQALRAPKSTWKNPLMRASEDYIPDWSIVIAGEIGLNLDNCGDNQALLPDTYRDCAVLRARAGAPSEIGRTQFALSLHASLYELSATALAIKCWQVALYHSPLGDGVLRSPLANLLTDCGRSVVHLDETYRLIGG